MGVELVTFKLDKEFLSRVDTVAKEAGYSNRTDFIRNTLREKVDEIKFQQAYIRISALRGKSNKKTTDEELHLIRERVVQKYKKKFDIK